MDGSPFSGTNNSSGEEGPDSNSLDFSTSDLENSEVPDEQVWNLSDSDEETSDSVVSSHVNKPIFAISVFLSFFQLFLQDL